MVNLATHRSQDLQTPVILGRRLHKVCSMKFSRFFFCFIIYLTFFTKGYPPYPPQGGYPPGGAGFAPQPGFQQPGFPQPGFQQPGFPGGFMPPPHIPPTGGYGGYVDPEDPEGVKGFDFTDESIRKGFIRKVYSILMVS
jgi:hypothetical protein